MKVREKDSQHYSLLAYRPELDVTPFCNPEQHNLFQMLIAILHWLIGLERTDMQLEK